MPRVLLVYHESRSNAYNAMWKRRPWLDRRTHLMKIGLGGKQIFKKWEIKDCGIERYYC
jgi:hypothetical protein